MGEILDGRRVASELESSLVKEIKRLKKSKITPNLAIIETVKNSSNESYTNNLRKKFKELKLKTELHSSNADKKHLVDLILELNEDKEVHGILVQSPLPKELNQYDIYDLIEPRKDVDGVNTLNARGLNYGREFFQPCTPKGILSLLDSYKISVENKKVVILGRSEIVGAPLRKMMYYLGADVESCNSKTQYLEDKTRAADILISSIGKPYFITKDMIKDGAVVIDVGTNYIKNCLLGDVNFEEVKPKASFITPVPGGVGPMTVISLAENLVYAATINKL